MAKNQTFIWSTGWWIENNDAWFVSGEDNILFHVDLSTGKCDNEACLPESNEKAYCLNPNCFKRDRDIFCIPGFEQCIWVYNLDNHIFTKIGIDKPKEPFGRGFWILGDAVYIVPGNWNKVIEMSISQRVITNYYTICKNDSIQRSTLVGDKIYAASTGFGRIYQFDLFTKEMNTIFFPDMEKKCNTICFDGKRFWMSGYQKELYVWDKERDNFTIISNFPEGFEIPDFRRDIDKNSNMAEMPMFSYSVVVGRYIWFIPRLAEKIVYVDVKNETLFLFDIFEADETKEQYLARVDLGLGNYLLEYVRDERYIGLFSTRNRRIVEIDAEQLSFQWKEYYLSDKYIQYCGKLCDGIYYEGSGSLYDQAYVMEIQTANYKINNIEINDIGKKIHSSLVRERK